MFVNKKLLDNVTDYTVRKYLELKNELDFSVYRYGANGKEIVKEITLRDKIASIEEKLDLILAYLNLEYSEGKKEENIVPAKLVEKAKV